MVTVRDQREGSITITYFLCDRETFTYAYLVTSIVTGARTEEIRALRWGQIDNAGEVPTIHVWASVREGGDTKTHRSRRSLELPALAVKAIGAHRAMQARERLAAAKLRHTFVSLLSDHEVSIEEISLLVGHNGTDTTERVYRHQLRPVRRSAARAMDDILNDVG